MVTADLAAVVLAAGLGTRLRPLTELLPKALCPVDNVALVDVAIDRLGPLTDGDVAVNVHHHRQRMEAHLAGRDVHVSVEEGEPLGTAGALGRLREWIGGRAAIVHNADAWHAADLGPLLVDGWDGERIRLLVVAARPGSADFEDGTTFAGVSLMPWTDVDAFRPEPSGLWEVSWRRALDVGRLDLVHYDGPWFDTGTPANYLAANLAASGGGSVVAPDAVVEGTVDRCVVWTGARVESGEHLVEQIRAPGGITVDARP